MPRPFFTRLNSAGLAYWRKPGRLTLSRLRIAGCFGCRIILQCDLDHTLFVIIFKFIFQDITLVVQNFCHPLFQVRSRDLHNPVTAICALRILVRKSAIGSVTILFLLISFKFFVDVSSIVRFSLTESYSRFTTHIHDLTSSLFSRPEFFHASAISRNISWIYRNNGYNLLDGPLTGNGFSNALLKNSSEVHQALSNRLQLLMQHVFQHICATISSLFLCLALTDSFAIFLFDLI